MIENWDHYKDLEYYPDRVCGCGCEGRIKVQLHHKGYGIPRFINGHYTRIANPSNQPGAAAKISKSKIGKKQSKETRRKRSKSLQGHDVTEETKEKIRQRNIGKIFSSETIEKMRRSNKTALLWKRIKYVRMMVKAQHRKPNKLEKQLNKFLQEILPGEYQLNVKAEVMILDGKCPDFVNTNGQKKIIELFGDYWHGAERTGISNKQHEQERIILFAKYGYQTLIIWEHELKNIKMLERRIRRFSK